MSVTHEEYARRFELAFGHVARGKARIAHRGGPRPLLRPAQTIECKARDLGQLELPLAGPEIRS